ncbi:hypothetical protein TRICI_006487 [Trichomonascus ciferrii]|uniref:Uncharacterized protein n=1 Tax=Trichomonascus ciferrii TaxID=44093 RepID=A0A642UGS6_9ASCO|nr:hypothetical protein TRICI_006487 [Trichomonascus ciferrii]
MDTGLKYKPLAEEVSNAPKIENSEDFEEFIDSLVSRELSWHGGAMLMQNVLSCVYVEDILEHIFVQSGKGPMDWFLENFATGISSWKDVVYAYILGVIKSLNLGINILNDPTAIYQEEDIILNNAGYHFLDNTPTDKVIHVLKSALTWLKRQEASKGAKNRLELRMQFLHVMNNGTPSNLPNVTKALKIVREITPRAGQKYESAYTEGVQSRVTNTSPLRPLKSEQEAYKQLEEILQTAEEISATVPRLTKSTDLLSYFLAFSAKRPRPLPIARGLLKSIVSGTNGTIMSQSQIHWVTQDMKELTCSAPGTILETTNPQIKQALNMFLEQAALCYSDLITVMCQNRSRQRQNLAHCILSFDSLQVNAEQLETEVGSMSKQDTVQVNGTTVPGLPVSCWVYLRKLQIMIWAVFLGFELDIYKLWEYSRMYYYGNFLLDYLDDHLNRIQVYLEQKLQKNPRSQGLMNSQTYIQALQVESNALNQLCQAAMYLAIAFERANLIKLPPQTQATTSELLYGLRMKPFSSVGVPEKPSFEEFTQTTSAVKDPIENAKKYAHSCRMFIDNLSKMSQTNTELGLLKRSSVGMAISCSMLEKGSISSIELSRENYHWFFPVISKSTV